jgi:peptidoglycan/LPS O-acetylase OafA/YrhL
MRGELTLRYRPALDGIRAVAVLAVIAFHDGYDWARGGYLGVDTFFVLSGFLITTLLLLEHRRTGTIGLLEFWGRRLRRLLPALLLVLLAVAAYGAFVVSPYRLGQLRWDTLSSLGYFTNWRFIAGDASYADIFTSPSPVAHLWSLAIEEQFYLVWPLVVLGCVHLARGSHKLLLGVSVAGLAASALVMTLLYDSRDPSRAYYGTDARIQTILVGAVLAIWLADRPPRRARHQRVVQVAGLLGAAAVLWSIHAVPYESPGYFHGGSLLFAIAVAAVIAAVMQPARTGLQAGLALAPIVWVGRISYGLYLWHLPVNVYLNEARVGVGGNALNLLRLAVTFACATASFYIVEMPIRRGTLHRHVRVAFAPVGVALTGAALVTATVGAAPLPTFLGGGTTIAAVAPPQAAALVERATPPRAATPVIPTKQGEGAETTFDILMCPPPSDAERASALDAVNDHGGPPPWPADGQTRVLVIGDSLGCSVAIGLEAAGEPELDVRQIAIIGCGVVSREVWDDKEKFPRGTERCDEVVTARLSEALAGFQPQVVVWVSTWERMNLVVGDLVLETGSEPWRRELRARLDAMYGLLRGAGAHVLVTTIAPPAPAELLDGGRLSGTEFDWRFIDLNAVLRAFVAAHPEGATLVDVAGKVCPGGPPCESDVEGSRPRRTDGVHFDPPGAVWLSRWFLPALRASAP